MRIARALALAGIDSRRKCEIHIINGAVKLNGQVVQDLGRQVDIESDEILFRGKPVHFENSIYFVLNKPVGYTTTALDPHAKKTVYDLLPAKLVAKTSRQGQSRIRVFPVGRLDKNSTGILLFTNDGMLANRLIHPRYGVAKWYQVRLDRAFDPRDVKHLLAGVRLEEGVAKAEKVHGVTKRILRILIREGKNREIRRIFEKLGYEVVDLCRIAFGPIVLGPLPLGQGRYLSFKEVHALKEVAFKTPTPPSN